VSAAQPSEYPGLHNVVAYTPGLISGSVPEGAAGFASLAAMGVKTVMSVDGAVPDVAAAKSYGIRYVHLPVGYNGFDEARKLELARAVRDLSMDGPVYIHCHHGKHRSAGAAAAVAVSLGQMSPQDAVARMKVSGTSPQYAGLYQCAATATALSAAAIDAAPATFPAVTRPLGMVKSMVEIDEASDRLKLVRDAGWKAPEAHPDLVAVAEAGRMADLLRVLAESPSVKQRPSAFQKMMAESQRRAQRLEDSLAAAGSTPDVAALGEQFKALSASCTDCHRAFRD
jgi:protein tyrosine phosphatase (PTP) superfamily phosphohydrolase (DUF442 family)